MELTIRRIPALVQLCQRVASAHVESISSLGDELSYELVKPILERCSAEQLLRLEQTSPHFQKDTPQIWKDLCFRKYSMAMERYTAGETHEPDSWKDQYFLLHEAEAKRIEEAGIKLRNQRLEAAERKREREVKLTDRVPPPKRSRTGWPTNIQPKTLFQKTRTEASKIQKNMYNARIIPPMPTNGKIVRVLSKPLDAILPILPTSTDTGRVVVNTVVHRRPSVASASPSTSASSSRSTSALSSKTSSLMPSTSFSASSPCQPSTVGASEKQSSKQSPTRATIPPAISESRPLKSLITAKKDPMAALFLPKRRTGSQRLP